MNDTDDCALRCFVCYNYGVAMSLREDNYIIRLVLLTFWCVEIFECSRFDVLNFLSVRVFWVLCSDNLW